MIDYFGMVKEFHKKYEHYTSTTPQKHSTIPVAVMNLRYRLIEEELGELLKSETKVEIADAIGDLLYVVFGAAIAYGIPLDEVFTEIHRSNMTKEGTNAYGKTIKGAKYEPPNIKKILE